MRKIEKCSKFYSTFIEKGSICYDVGSNIGNRTASLVNIGARVVAIEPQPQCVKKLKKRFRGRDDVKVIQTSLGTEDGEGFLKLTKASTIASMNSAWISKVQKKRFKKFSRDKELKVPITCLDKLILMNNNEVPFFIKIDVEGFEYEVLKGLHHSVPYISFEYVPEILCIAINCINYLNFLDNRYEFNYSVEENFAWGLKDWVDKDNIIDIIKKQNVESFGDVYARLKSYTNA